MGIRPIGKKVLLSIVDVKESIQEGIIVQGGARRDAVREAVVAALPNGYKGILSVGDTVYIKPWCGAEVVYGKMKYVFAKEDEIMAVCEL